MKYKQIIEPIKGELEEVEKKIEDFIEKSELKDFFSSSYINKGKKVRPAIVLLSGKAIGEEKIDDLIDYATAVELFHNSTLIHDDIVDGSKARRGELSFNEKFGNSISVFLGDYLLLFVNEILIKKKRNIVMEAFLISAKDVLYGETIEALENGNLELKKEKYIEIVEKKTASLFSLSFEIGVILSEKNYKYREKSKKAGKFSGIAFQLIDDILDYTGDEKIIGKPVMNDLKEKEITLPLILAMEENNKLKQLVIEYFKSPDREKIEEIKMFVLKTSSIERTRKIAETYIQKSEKIIKDIFPDSIYKNSILELLRFFYERVK